ncbi:hypothetical protein BGAL_1036g00020 [Botrytis galanthina]|uniref:Uncharacterized protein n=1 Tax=Botrytis galanthina TaxID=278940 RepID=A0A4S8QL20_9HELO|nr:hypothetical protein BGAL_1036g00020 [Botrytis galanthina]
MLHLPFALVGAPSGLLTEPCDIVALAAVFVALYGSILKYTMGSSAFIEEPKQFELCYK